MAVDLATCYAVSLDYVVQVVVDAASLGCLYALFALGIALIFGVMQLVNFAHGELIMIGAYGLVLLADVPLLLRLAIMLALTVTMAIVIERSAFRPVRAADPATLLVTSFAVSVLLQSLALMIVGSTPKSGQLSSWLDGSFDIGGIALPRLTVLAVVVGGLLLVGVGLFLRTSRRGLEMRAASEDPEMLRLLGVGADRVITLAFALSGLLAGVAAFFLVAQTGTVVPDIGTTPVLIAFIATVIGGMGSLLGACLGGLLLGALTVTLQTTLPLELRSFRDAFLFALVALLLVVRPQGLIVAASTRVRAQ